MSFLPRVTRRITLLHTFSLLSAAIMILIGLLLASRLQGVVETTALRQESAVVVGQAQALVPDGLLTHGRSGDLTPAALRQLALFTQANMRYGHFVRVKIWSPTGTVLYSDMPALVGRRFSLDDGLADVLAGRAPSYADISSLGAQENATERPRFGRLLEVYVPIRAGRRTGRIVGAYELYHDLTALDSQEAEVRRAIWGSVAAGFLVLYVSLFLVVRNASRRLVRQAASLAHQASHDALTNLPNRVLLQDRMQQALRAARRAHTSVALLLLDLDRFKEVNDTFGHHHGDQLLQQVGQRIGARLRAGDTIARLGGDEFAVLLPANVAHAAGETAERILHSLEQPFMLEGYSISVGASIGITLFPDHGEDGTILLRRADVAMYAAKRAQLGQALYAAEQDQYSPSRLALTGELRTGIEEDQLCLYYQPKVDLRTGQLDSVEALVRWQHPTRGFLPPDQFIPLAEQTGLITPLTHWVVTAALRQCRAWQDAGHPIRVAVNLSARLLHDEHLVDTISLLLRQHGVPSTLFEVEITESAVMADPGRALATLTRLHQMGVRLAIDDFGTGYSSLAYLKRLPVDEVKIDKSFVRDMASSGDDASIARSIVHLGHDLGLTVVAEGVEDRGTWNQLWAMGCDQAQGYYMSRPIPAAELMVWVRGLPSVVAQTG